VDVLGRVLHREFLADCRTDPRPAFAQSLLAALRHRREPILVWSSFESSRLGELAQALPEHAAEIARVRARLVDLHPIVRGHVGHPEFGGSFSLKQVVPVLAPEIAYDDLDGVSDGGEAASALVRLALGAVESAEEEAAPRAPRVLPARHARAGAAASGTLPSRPGTGSRAAAGGAGASMSAAAGPIIALEGRITDADVACAAFYQHVLRDGLRA
jgi:hypothetical protein